MILNDPDSKIAPQLWCKRSCKNVGWAAPTSQHHQQDWHVLTASKNHLQLSHSRAAQLSDFTQSHRNDKTLQCGTSFTQTNTNRALFLQGWGQGAHCKVGVIATQSFLWGRNNLTGWVKPQCRARGLLGLILSFKIEPICYDTLISSHWYIWHVTWPTKKKCWFNVLWAKLNCPCGTRYVTTYSISSTFSCSNSLILVHLKEEIINQL